MATKRLRVAVLLSGSGRTLQNFIDLTDKGELPIEIVLVISSLAGVKGIERAERASIPVQVIERKKTDAATFDKRITEAIDAAGAELVCLAGFLSMWDIPPQYENKVMNIHPALLPRFGGKGFYGHHVHEAVLAAGEKQSGCTVHFANNEYDAGPIILQKTVPVMPDDTPDMLAARVFEQECAAYPEAIRLFADGRLTVRNGQVEIR